MCSCSTEREQILGGSNKGFTSRDEVPSPTPHGACQATPGMLYSVLSPVHSTDVDRLERVQRRTQRQSQGWEAWDEKND